MGRKFNASLHRIITLVCILFCSSMLFFQFSFSFQDIGLEFQKILQKAQKAALAPMPDDVLPIQKAMFNKLETTMSEEQILLGKILYFDPRLSRNKNLSCNSCHNVSLQGSSLLKDSRGVYPPSLYNMLFNDVAYLDGSISAQDRADKNNTIFQAKNIIARSVLKALVAENEMNSDMSDIILSIKNSQEYMAYFKRAYGSKVNVTPNIIAQAIAAFIMTLNTQSRYDDFIAGNIKAMSIKEARGLEVFIDKGCVACHTGVNLGGTLQPFGVMKDYKFAKNNALVMREDKMLKTPSLRNVALKSFYFHDGGFTSLADAIREMGSIQLGIRLSSTEISQIMDFLETLNGKVDSISLPILPKM